MELQELPLERRVTDMLQNQNPTRVVVFLRKKSPFYSLERDEVMVKACGSLDIDQVKSRAKLLTIWKCDRLTIFAFDLWYDDYDWATAHHKVDLPVLLIDYGKRSYVKVAGHEFQDEVNNFVARQHELHGWDAKPPYFQDQTGPEVPTYGNPRCVMVVGEDGTRRRAVKTPPPGSTNPHSSVALIKADCLRRRGAHKATRSAHLCKQIYALWLQTRQHSSEFSSTTAPSPPWKRPTDSDPSNASSAPPRMVELRGRLFSPTNRTKRPRLEEPRTADTQIPKKRKLSHPSVPPSQFWDNLSRPVLTKNALRELDCRNSIGDHHQSRVHNTRRRYNTRSVSVAAHTTPAQKILSQLPPTGRAQLKLTARHGGPDLEDLRGYRPPTNLEMSSSQSSLGRRKRGSQSALKSNATANTTTTRSTGPYDRAFQQHLIDHHVFPPDYEYPNGDELPEPENIDDIKRVLEQSRKSLSPSRFSKEEFKKFKRADAHATKESRVVATVIPIIEGDAGDPRGVASDIAFSNLDHLTDGSLVCAKPDLYYGARPEQLNKEVREALSNFIIPSTQDDLPIAPNNFLEVKGPDGSLSVATRQAIYNAALGSRALQALQSYGTEQIHDIKAYTLAWTYHGGTLKAYASHRIPPSTPEKQFGYAMTQLKGWSMTSDADTFRQGATAYRNGRDWAKLQRDQAIAQANKIVPMPAAVELPHTGLPAEDASESASHAIGNELSLASHQTTDTSEDKLSLKFTHPPKRSHSLEKHDSTMNVHSQDLKVNKLHVHNSGTSGAVWRIGGMFCQVKAWLRGMDTEAETLRSVEARFELPVPEVVFDWIDEDLNRSFVIPKPVHGRTLQQAWPSLSPERRQTIATQVAECCDNLAKETSDSMGSPAASDYGVRDQHFFTRHPNDPS
ncbi:hypothetical protein F66182_3226 [Fusarium sp. NRRL 66182]|nr:hypothetical protein F66182_3226 [Fusarium sp. NRRL 66182]